MFAGKVHNLRHFCLGDLVGEYSAFTDPVLVYVHHDPVRSFGILVEETLEHVNHKFHRRIVVIEQQYTVQIRPLGLRPGLGDDRSTGTALIAFALAIIVGKSDWCHGGNNVNPRHWFVCLPGSELLQHC